MFSFFIFLFFVVANCDLCLRWRNSKVGCISSQKFNIDDNILMEYGVDWYLTNDKVLKSLNKMCPPEKEGETICEFEEDGTQMKFEKNNVYKFVYDSDSNEENKFLIDDYVTAQNYKCFLCIYNLFQ